MIDIKVIIRSHYTKHNLEDFKLKTGFSLYFHKMALYLTWASFNNIRMLLMACMPVVIFYLIWLVNTSEGIRSEEGTLLDLVCWPDGNAIPVIIATGSVIAVVIEVSIHDSHRFKVIRQQYTAHVVVVAD